MVATFIYRLNLAHLKIGGIMKRARFCSLSVHLSIAAVLTLFTTGSFAKGFNYNGVNVQLGGFLASETVYRDNNMASDVATNFSKIPFKNSAQYGEPEFRGSERQSRFSLLAQGLYNHRVRVSGYYELDFLGAATTANSNESNSYNPRTRVVYLDIDWLNSGWHLLAGQDWSLVTLNSDGITPRHEVLPPTIDAQYAVGFNWARQWQTRIVKNWGKKYWAALSLENPQTTAGGSAPTGYGAVYQFGPGSLFSNKTSMNSMPDIIVKFAWQPSFAHFEVYNLTRNFESEYGLIGSETRKQSTWTDAAGAGVIVPFLHKKVKIKLSGLVGDGIGRYGTAQLPDVTYASDGRLEPLSGEQYLAQLSWHARADLTSYITYGLESVNSSAGSGYGYGNSAVTTNAGCSNLGGTCSAEAKSVNQINLGFWWQIYKMQKFGVLNFGAQYSHTSLDTFADATGISPSTSENMVFTSLRYYPF